MYTDDMDQLAQALRGTGYSLTGPRAAVFMLLRSSGPSSPSFLAKTLQGKIDRATVYRTLELFNALGFTRDITSGHRRLVELGDRFDPHHHHMTCIRCGTSINVADPAVEASLSVLAERVGYRLEAHQLELGGVCPPCQTKGF